MAAGRPSHGAALGWALRSAHLMAAHPPSAEQPPHPRPRGPPPAAEHGEPRGAGKGRRMADRRGPLEEPGAALLRAERPQLLRAHPAALPSPPRPPEATARPHRPIAAEAAGPGACALRLSTPLSAILKEGAVSRRAEGKVRARRCASPRPCAAARARPALPALQEAGRRGAGLSWPRPLLRAGRAGERRVNGAGVAWQRSGAGAAWARL